ncbi:alpha/beta hydrolase [Actinomadura rugatobispora]|uniref:Alpha/beta hydrolase n=1 Tax=Actinomadura rugatobispora TaxID=1994 RepID=A0ABW0ZS87_9ACTN|nr:alpha/beta hydrolase [Actinomadura rugatobispora]
MTDVLPASEYMDEVREINSALASMPHPDVTTEEGLAALRAAKFSPDLRPTLKPVESTFAGPEGRLRARIIRPDGPIRAVLLNIHGGGFCIGDPADDDLINDLIARHAHVAVVSTSYRLAPENPFPACLEDCIGAARWLLDTAERSFGTDRLLVAGASAGGYLAAQVLNWMKAENHIERVVAASFMFGVYDVGRTPSQAAATEETLVLPSTWLDQFHRNAFPGLTESETRSARYSPLYAADLSGMPPALFTVGDLDPLVDDSLFLAARWRTAGNETQLDVWSECVHGFLNMYPKVGAQARERIADWIAARLDTAGL